ncbi:MAG: ABC transporter ATP-binding protein [Acidimicrobiales bacterium]|nr:ABC transporter ATP-binding protein [Acidimicrobiales bacterium]
MKQLLKVWPWVKPYWIYLAGALAGTVLSVGISLLIPLQTARVIDEGIAKSDGELVRSTVLFMVALILAGVVVSATTSAMAVRMAFNTITDLRRDLYGHAQHFSFGNLDRLTSGGILTRLTSDMTKVTTILTMGLAFIAQTPLMFVGALIAILSIDASLLIIVLVMIPAIGGLVWYVLARSGVLYDAVQNRLDRLNTVLQENIEGTEAIKAFVRQDFETEQFDEVADDLAHQATIVNQLVAALMPTLIAISSLGIAAVIWLGGNNVIDGNLSEGDLVAFISYMAMVTMPMMMLAFVQPLISAAGASMARIDQVLQEQPEVPQAADGIDLGAQLEPGDIRFENVSFAYRADDADDTLDNALTSINLHIRQGTTVAVLGATGSGKSSLVHLIPRFYDTSEGTVYVGGIDVRRLSKDSLRRNVGVALQEPQLFGGTVMENIRYGRPDATDDEVFAAAKAAQAHDFITAMPDGYNSLVEQQGANLSGGQRQRMAIARTLLVGPAILILDDSTSAVDSETEEQIQRALEPLSNQTVILVAQRISTALGADEIVVLDDGHVCAHGSHRDLMESSPVYQEIYRSQLGETVQ